MTFQTQIMPASSTFFYGRRTMGGRIHVASGLFPYDQTDGVWVGTGSRLARNAPGIGTNPYKSIVKRKVFLSPDVPRHGRLGQFHGPAEYSGDHNLRWQ